MNPPGLYLVAYATVTGGVQLTTGTVDATMKYGAPTTMETVAVLTDEIASALRSGKGRLPPGATVLVLAWSFMRPLDEESEPAP